MIDIDSTIFILFLIVNLVLGLFASRGVKTIRGYAVGDKTFSTATLVFTIVSIWVSGEFFFTIVAESYKEGLIFMTILVADFLSYLFIGIFFAARLKEFLGKISIAEAMDELFGNRVRAITAISGVVGVTGIIAIQLQIAGLLFEYALGVEHFYGTIFAGIIITLYSSLGGIRSVTFTDIIQFGTFGVVIPFIAYTLLSNIGDSKVIIDTLSKNPAFDYKSVFSFDNPQIYYYISLFLWLFIPNFNPAIFQRIAMAKDTKQVHDSFVIAAFIGLLLAALVCWIGVLVLSYYPNIDGQEILKHTISNYSWINGFKGLILSGIMAMIMSTVDSYINSNSILLVHDLNNSLNTKFIQHELYATKVCSLLIGIVSVLIALRGGNFFELILWTSTCYMPIVTVPFMMALFGFRSSEKSVLAGMIAGFTVTVLWELILKSEMGNVGGLIPGMLANLVVLLSYHYIFNQSGGWVGIKDPSVIEALQEERKKKLEKLVYEIKSFSLLEVCRKNAPKSDGLIAFLGFFVMVSVFSSVNTLPDDIYDQNVLLMDSLYIITLCTSSLLISYPLWLRSWKKSNFVSILWNFVSVLILICFGFLLILLSNFSEMQLMSFMFNVIVIASLSRWRWSLFSIIFGITITLLYYKYYIDILEIRNDFTSLEFKVVYLLLLISSTLIIFFKPKQEYLEETEAKIDTLETEVTHLHEKVVHYNERISDQEKEIERLGATAQKILNNVNHELRLPVGNVMNFAEMLGEGLGKFSEDQLKTLSDEVYKNSNRLSSMIMNMLDLATLNAKKLELDKKIINLGELVEDRVNNCRRIYLEDKKINFELKIHSEIFVSVDPNYMRQVVDNLVINAIKFSSEGVISVQLLKNKDKIEFTIKDNGIGIPREELYDIFTPFKMGSNTESKAEGRGVGLALCKAAIEAHGGAIIVQSDGVNGARFRFVL